ILGEVVAYGANCDANHMTTPTPDGSGAAKAMVLAMEEAGISPENIGYINAHGTSTQANDSAESKANELALGDAAKTAYVSSTK
ncbi:beta-ketoacyl-[acyl-carrier-protein] synthase II, partial [Enterococcus faecalis]